MDREPPSATEWVARFRLRVRQIPLRELEEAEILDVDCDSNEVTEGPRFDETWETVFGERWDEPFATHVRRSEPL